MNLIRSCIALAFVIQFGISASAQPKVILKLDDIEARNGQTNFKTVLEYLKREQIKAGLGIIGKRVDGTALATLSPYLNATNSAGEQLFEIWHHGYDHIDPEFGGTPYSKQKQHFEDTDRMVRERLGIQMQTFGPPFNRSDATTRQVFLENPNYRVFLFTSAEMPGVVSLGNRVELEVPIFEPNLTGFLNSYNANKDRYRDYIVLQGHPSSWGAEDSTRFSNFKQIIQFLIAEGCEFVTPVEMAVVAEIDPIFSADPVYGDVRNYLPNPSTNRNWRVDEIESDPAYVMADENINARSGNRLGELSVATPEHGDFNLQLDARTLVSPGRVLFANFAMVFGYKDDLNYNYMLLGGTAANTRLYAVDNGERGPAIGVAEAAGIQGTAWQGYRLARTGDEIEVYRGENLILRAADPLFGRTGKVGVGVLSEAAAFDNITVTGGLGKLGGAWIYIPRYANPTASSNTLHPDEI